jgi:hypothetical protein
VAVRNDVTVQFNLSPRIITVAAPSTSITIQDLHDTLRAIEDEPGVMQYPDLIRTAGKESLGSGKTVGLTATLRNARLAFEARKTSASSGTVTASDSTGRVLVDAGATFVSDGVQPGAWLVNLSDGSVCSVITVDSETQVTTDGLGDGTTSQWQIGDDYKVWNVVPVEVTDGNLVAIDEVNAEINPILPTAGTQVNRTASSSATLIDKTAGVASALTVVGSTNSVVKTDIVAPANFYDGMLVQITDGQQSVVRRIDFQAADGTLYPSTALPFTPSTGSDVLILSQHDVGIGAVS